MQVCSEQHRGLHSRVEDHGEKKKKINHVFIKPLAFLFLFFLPAYMLNVLHASHKGQKKNMAIYF